MSSSDRKSDDPRANARSSPPREPGDDPIDDREFDPALAERRGSFERLRNYQRMLDIRETPADHNRPSDPSIAESMTDASHAERFAQCYGLDLRYDHRRDRWLIYEGPRWKPDIDGGVYRLAIQFARMRQMQSVLITDRKVRELALKHFIAAESKNALDRCVALARVLPPIADSGEHWDLDPWLLCAPNGVIDLKTGYIREGDPADRITMSTAVEYDPHADAPRWRQFVSEIFDGNTELASFVQRFVGYSLTGCTHEQILSFLYGRGANGKGTFMNTITYVLGDYAYNMPFSTIEMRQRSAIPNDVAALEKRRWVTGSETNEGTRLNEARIKALTGCDPITARFLHGEWFTFQPVAKFILAVNHKPTVQDDSYGFWRRIRLVPFMRQFIGDQRDPTLEGQFREDEAKGILRWCVEGCLAWQRLGLAEPDVIMTATNEYRQDSDILSDFFTMCVEDDDTSSVQASAIQQLYQKWADRNGIQKQERMSAKLLGQRLAEKLTRRHTRQGWIYEGIRLRTDDLF